ncbi:MAG: hypothetical protein K0S83_585, partial [Thermomicrobiales bacterium]|nr:hypothetical protein [Thermomicrobiales bacterium]
EADPEMTFTHRAELGTGSNRDAPVAEYVLGELD